MSGHDESAILAGVSHEGETGIYERSISCASTSIMKLADSNKF